MSTPTSDPRYALVTGGTSGLGQAVALALARIGMEVTIVGRNPQRGKITLTLLREYSGGKGSFLQTDLASICASQRMVDEYLNTHSALHVLVLSAGVMNFERVLTAEGLETVFATNHLNRFFLINLLLDALKAGAPSRIVIIGSAAIGSWPKIDFENLQAEKGFNGNRAMSQALLANDVMVAEIARRMEGTGVTINAMHPGWVKTNIMRSSPGFMRLLMPVMTLISVNIEKGARAPIDLATSPDMAEISGAYFNRTKRITPPASTTAPALAERLWQANTALIDRILGGILPLDFIHLLDKKGRAS